MMRGFAGRFGRSAAGVAAVVLAVGTAAACSSSGSAGSGGGGGAGGGAKSGGSGAFQNALKDIHATAQTGGYIEFGDTAQLAKINGGGSPASTGPFAGLLAAGSGELGAYETVLAPLTGFDATAAAGAISVGSPPNAVSVLYGSFDPAAIGAKLSAWGYHSQDRGDGVTAWIVQDDHRIDMSKLDPNTGVGPGMAGWLNVIWVSKSRIAFGGATSDLAAALPAQSKPLSDDAAVAPLADCLGSAVAAVVLTDQRLIQNSKIPAIAFGVTATSASDVREEICAAAPDAAGAQAFAAAFTKAVTSGNDYLTNQTWADLLTDPQTKVIGGAEHVVLLSAKPVDPKKAALVVNLVQNTDFAGLLGLPQKMKDGRTVNPDGTVVPAAPSSSSS